MSQDDPRTIAEYVADELTDHNEDPEAHLVEGGSLALHKSEDIIDHPQGSVLADKWTNSELDFTTTFENLASFYSFGDTSELWPGFLSDPSGTLWANRAGVLIDGESGGLEMNTANDLLVQFSFAVEQTSNSKIVMRLGEGSPVETNFRRGIGAYVENNSLKFFAGNAAGTTVNESSAITINDNQTYILRVFSNSQSGEIECYLDGVLVATLTWPVSSYVSYADVAMYTWTTGTGTSILRVRSLYFSIQP